MDESADAVHLGGIGPRNRARLETLHRNGRETFTATDAAGLWGLPRPQAGQLLAAFARRGWLARIGRGIYLPVPLDSRRPGEWTADPWVLADRMFAPCYVAGWSACEHWDLTEQLFRTVLVITARPLRRREPAITGVQLQLHHRPEHMQFGTVGVWRGQTKVRVSDPSRTIVDILDDPQLGGGIQTAADVLLEYLDSSHRSDRLVIEYGDRLGNRTVFKRLGALLELLGVQAPQLIDACLERRSTGLGTLDPSVASRGRIVRRWGLRVNVALMPPEAPA